MTSSTDNTKKPADPDKGPDSPEVKPFDDRPQYEDEALSGFVQTTDSESSSRGGQSDDK